MRMTTEPVGRSAINRIFSLVSYLWLSVFLRFAPHFLGVMRTKLFPRLRSKKVALTGAAMAQDLGFRCQGTEVLNTDTLSLLQHVVRKTVLRVYANSKTVL